MRFSPDSARRRLSRTLPDNFSELTWLRKSLQVLETGKDEDEEKEDKEVEMAVQPGGPATVRNVTEP